MISFSHDYDTDVPSVRTFLEEYEKAAKYLKVYNISLAVVSVPYTFILT